MANDNINAPVDEWYLGIDCSTQSLTAIILDQQHVTQHTHSVRYDDELPEFGTRFGVHHGGDGVVTSPVAMFVAALDMCLDAMTRAGVDWSRVVALSCSGQQHGSVYWSSDCHRKLASLDAAHSLCHQLCCVDGGVFAETNCPVWMDSSTTKQCRQLERRCGGAERVAAVSGSRAFERFTGNQIAKLFEVKPDVYASSERVSLISSFLGSLFLGKICQNYHSDGFVHGAHAVSVVLFVGLFIHLSRTVMTAGRA
jgi:xylulokinase